MSKKSSRAAKNRPNSKTNFVPMVGVLLLLVAVGVFWYVSGGFGKNELVQKETENVGPTPTPIPILQGKEIYQVSQAKDWVGPQIRSVEIVPHDPKIGEKQKIRVTADYDSGVKSVAIKLLSDDKDQQMSLSQVKTEGSTSVWEGEWKVSNSVL